MAEPSDARPVGAAHTIRLGAAWTVEAVGLQVVALRRFGCPSGLTGRHRVRLVLAGAPWPWTVTLNGRPLPLIPQRTPAESASHTARTPAESASHTATQPAIAAGDPGGPPESRSMRSFDLTGLLLRRNELRVERAGGDPARATGSDGPRAPGGRSLPLSIDGFQLEDAWLEITDV